MLLLPSHREGGEGEGAIIEGELKGNVHGVEEHLLAHQLDLQLLVIKVPSHFPYLAHRVIDEAPAFAPIMKGQTCIDRSLKNLDPIENITTHIVGVTSYYLCNNANKGRLVTKEFSY